MKHGQTWAGGYTKTYGSWLHMRGRCLTPTDPKYPDYGGRGITICERWAEFENFFTGMGERPKGTSLERRDNDGNYEPGNCYWVTPKAQARNRRNSKLTAEQVLEIKAMIERRPINVAACKWDGIIGRQYGVSGKMIYYIRRGTSWQGE